MFVAKDGVLKQKLGTPIKPLLPLLRRSGGKTKKLRVRVGRVGAPPQ